MSKIFFTKCLINHLGTPKEQGWKFDLNETLSTEDSTDRETFQKYYISHISKRMLSLFI